MPLFNSLSPKVTTPLEDTEPVQRIKTEIPEDDYNSDGEKGKGSILEAALDPKEQGPSILERSLMSSSSTGKKNINKQKPNKVYFSVN